MFAPAYMGRKRVLRMLSLHVHGLLLLTAVSAISKSVGRGCAPSSSAHVRWGEHGAPVQGGGLRSLLCLGDVEELYKARAGPTKAPVGSQSLFSLIAHRRRKCPCP